MLAGDSMCRNAALSYLGKHDKEGIYRELVTRLVVDVVYNDHSIWGLEGRQVLGLLPWTPVGCTSKLWDDLLSDGSVEVVRNAVRGVGERGDLSRTDWLIDRLDHPQLKTDIRGALVLLAQSDDSVFLKPGELAKTIVLCWYDPENI